MIISPQHTSESLFANQIKGESRNRTSFALFPVRIETRFMKMTLPQIKERHRVLDAFQQMNILLDWAISAGKNSALEVDRKELAKSINMLANTTGYLDGIYREDKILLERLVSRMNVPVDYLITRVPEDERNDALASMRTILTDMATNAASIPTVNAMKADKATRLLDEYEKVFRRIKAISALQTTPYSGYHHEAPKEGNIKLISHLERHLDECRNFVRSLPGKLSELPSMSAEQRARFTRYTKLLLIGKEFGKRNALDFPPDSILETEGSLKLAYVNLSRVQFRFSEEEWKDGKDRLMHTYKYVIDSIWKDLWCEYNECRNIIHGKPLTTVRYTHLISQALSMKVEHVSSLLKGKADYSYNTATLGRMLNNACFDYQKGRRFTYELLEGIKDLSSGGKNAGKSISFPDKYPKPNRTAIRKEDIGKKTNCLCVRIYPDEIGVNRFVKGLTLQERYDGMAFWLRYKMAQNAGDNDLMKAAWSMLCDHYAPYRAGWIARSLRVREDICSKFDDMFGREAVLNIVRRRMDFINEKIAEYLPGLESVRNSAVWSYFPDVVERNPNDFGKPVSPVLPDRFVFEGKVIAKGHKPFTIVKYGRRVFPNLQVAIDFNENLDIDPFAVDMETGALTVNSGIRWMTSYALAEKMGMAITIPLDGLEDVCFESIYVMGVKSGSTSDARRLMNDTLLSHFYSEEGLDLLKIGTPTNILDDQAADASYDTSREALSDMHYQHDVLEPDPSVQPGSDAARLATVLGTGKSSLNDSVLGRLAHAGNMDIQKSVSSNAILADYFFKPSTRNPKLKSTREEHRLQGFAGRVHNFISNDISSRGLFPPIRIGAQPYGIVPVTDFGNFMVADDNLYQLSKLLIWLTSKWNSIAEQYVIHEGNMAGTGNDDLVKNYIEMIGCTPTSSSFYARDYINNPDLLDPVYFKDNKDNLNSVRAAEDFISAILDLPKAFDSKVGDRLRSLMDKFDKLPIEKGSDSETGFRDPYLNEIEGNPWGSLPDRLKNVSDSETERQQLVAEFFDLFTYRLDAWTVGLLNYTIRRRIEKGIHKLRIGAFGWVFNLKPDNKEKKSEEYILAPSITHAITGAVLRSSYVKSMDKGGDARLCVNLSSIRVREALRIIRGLQNGLSVGAILGSDLERYLHDCWKTMGKEMDAFIYPLRQKYPLVADVTKSDENAETRIHTTIINGEALLHDLRQNIFCDESSELVDLYKNSSNNENLDNFLNCFNNKDEDKREILFLQIQRMEDSYDALRDVIMSESVYKLAEGNRVAVDALMNCLQQGRNVPMPDVVEVPMHSAHIEQRVIAALDPDADVADSGSSFMKIADPAVDKLIEDILSGSKRIESGFMRGSQVEIRSLSELRLSASELVYLSGNGESFNKFIEWSFARGNNYEWIPELAPSISMGDGAISLCESELVLDSLRDMLSDARILKADDLLMENANPESQYDMREFKARFNELYDKLSSLQVSMGKYAGEYGFNDTESRRPVLTSYELMDGIGYLLDCYSAGIATALDGLDPAMFPPESISADPHAYLAAVKAQETFKKSFSATYGTLSDRLAKVDISALDAENSVSKYTEAVQNLLVKSFKMAPKLMYAEPEFSRFHMDEEFIYSWLEDAAKVRRPIFDLQNVRMFARLHDFDEPEYEVMQLPGSAERWIGDGSGDIDESMINDAKSYVVLNSAYMYRTNKESVAGLVLDSWVERIPYKTQTAALTFSYDQPDAEAPHAILLAIAPNVASKINRYSGTYVSDNWSPVDFVRSIKSSMHLVKTRAVEPDHIYRDNFTSAFFPMLSVEQENR